MKGDTKNGKEKRKGREVGEKGECVPGQDWKKEGRKIFKIRWGCAWEERKFPHVEIM